MGRKNSIRIKGALWMTIMMLSYIVIVPSKMTSAHEVYGTQYKLRFNSLNSSKLPNIKVYKATTVKDSLYLNNYKTAVSNWNNVQCGSNKVTSSVVTDISKSNVHIMCDNSLWSKYGGTSTTLGMTIFQDTNNKIIQDTGVKKGTTKILRAMVILPTSVSAYKSGTSDSTVIKNRIIKTMTHEIGHAIGLGHPDRDNYNPISSSTYSIMRQGFPDKKKTGTTPQAHDKTDIKNMY